LGRTRREREGETAGKGVRSEFQAEGKTHLLSEEGKESDGGPRPAG